VCAAWHVNARARAKRYARPARLFLRKWAREPRTATRAACCPAHALPTAAPGLAVQGSELRLRCVAAVLRLVVHYDLELLAERELACGTSAAVSERGTHVRPAGPAPSRRLALPGRIPPRAAAGTASRAHARANL